MTTRARWLWAVCAVVCVFIASAAAVLAWAVRGIATHPLRKHELSQKITNGFLAAKGVPLSDIVPANAYCVVGVGQDPHHFMKKEFPKAVPVFPQEADDPFFLRSDSHWHLVLLQDNLAEYEVAPIAVRQINLVDQDRVARCSSDFFVSANQHVNFGQREWVLEITTSVGRKTFE